MEEFQRKGHGPIRNSKSEKRRQTYFSLALLLLWLVVYLAIKFNIIK
jgi:hypothetical protein